MISEFLLTGSIATLQPFVKKIRLEIIEVGLIQALLDWKTDETRIKRSAKQIL